MPNAATLSSAVDTATKCFATAFDFSSSEASLRPSRSHSHWRASRAFVRVSSVPKVFDATMKSVVSGSRSAVFS